MCGERSIPLNAPEVRVAGADRRLEGVRFILRLAAQIRVSTARTDVRYAASVVPANGFSRGYQPDDPTPDFARWIETGPTPLSQRPVSPPAPAVARVQLYDGTVAEVEVDVVAAGPGVVCVRQEVDRPDGSGAPWNAWVPSRLVRRR
jgi:hypothetical protein